MSGSLFLIRHGSTSYNAETPGPEKLRGWHDVPLATAGMLIARRAARALTGVPVAKIYTSDLRRAYDTARIMSVTLATPVEPTRDLRPWHLGDLAGQEVTHVADQLDKLTTSERHVPAPNGESFAEFLRRWRKELRALLREVEKSGQNVAAVTHARNLYALQELLFAEDIPVKGPPHPGAVLQLNGPFGGVSMQYAFLGDTGESGAPS